MAAVIGRAVMWAIGPMIVWGIKQIGGLLVWLGVTWFIAESDFGMELIWRWLRDTQYDPGHLVLPEWREDWTEAVCAANAWVPIAEAWVLFKLYWSMSVAAVSVGWTFRLMSLGK
jgi:hypothetical protein